MEKFFYTAIFSLFLIVFSTISHGQNDTNQTITVSKMQPTFSIQLPTTPGTGYSWTLTQYDRNFLTLNNHSIEKNTTMPGASQTETWQFTVNPNAFNPSHTFTLHLRYARPWKPDDAPKEATFTIVTQ